ncbi:hypothetical protein [Streptomyces sp. NBC_01465]|uniref:hypothetical protein n=1 Tax=Streptomyces sp. NBC_01465 TaxID=2903878 RepID=UPI002E2EADA9|nr:hypothetical protein [Streptomyces sp. NBC_01465]
MDENTRRPKPWIVGLRLVDLTVRYAVTFFLTLVATASAVPDEGLQNDDWLYFALFLGIPSLLISAVYGLANTQSGSAFRLPLAGLLLLPTWFLLFVTYPETLVVPVLGQLLFALCVMRAPLLRSGPSRVQRGVTLALAALTALTGCNPHMYDTAPAVHDATSAELVGTWSCAEGTELTLRQDGSASMALLDGQEFDFDAGWRLSGTGTWRLTSETAGWSGGQHLILTLKTRTGSAQRPDDPTSETPLTDREPAPETYIWTFELRRTEQHALQPYFYFGDPDSRSTYVLTKKAYDVATTPVATPASP